MSTKEDLIAAKAMINTPEKWNQGAYYAGGCFGFDRRCMLGAVMSSDVNFASRDATREALLRALPSSDRKRPHALATYNDTHSHGEVMAVFDRAIEAQP